jgi:hypothetical protein
MITATENLSSSVLLDKEQLCVNGMLLLAAKWLRCPGALLVLMSMRNFSYDTLSVQHHMQ